MKLFSRPKSENAANPTTGNAPEASAAGAGQGTAADQTVVPVGQGAGSPPEAAEFAQALDNSVKEMSEKIQRLTSNLDSVHEERQAFEEKLGRMEERMRKLSALTEMISNQYNPFIGDEPSDGGELAVGEGRSKAAARPVADNPLGGLGAPAVEAPPSPAPAPLPAPPVARPPAAPEVPEPLPEPFTAPAPEPALAPTPLPLPEPVAAPPAPAPAPAPEPAREPAPAAAPAWPPLFTAPPQAVAPMPMTPPMMPAAAHPAAMAHRAHLERIEPTFENHLVALNWANLLLKYSSPMGLLDLLGYYESLGWISKDVRKQLLAYAEGIAWNPNQLVADWRGNIELHQRTLLFIERLKGQNIEEDNYRALRRDITRIMGEDRRV